MAAERNAQNVAIGGPISLLSIVSEELSSVKPVDAGDAARAVFQVLNHHVDPHQVEKVRHALPEEVQALWPANNKVSSAA
jgi:uncharacterized protein (DUF2267 family)